MQFKVQTCGDTGSIFPEKKTNMCPEKHCWDSHLANVNQTRWTRVPSCDVMQAALLGQCIYSSAGTVLLENRIPACPWWSCHMWIAFSLPFGAACLGVVWSLTTASDCGGLYCHAFPYCGALTTSMVAYKRRAFAGSLYHHSCFLQAVGLCTIFSSLCQFGWVVCVSKQ